MRKTIFLCLTLSALMSSGQSGLKEFEKGITFLKNQNYQEAAEIFTRVLSNTTDPGLKKFSYIYRSFSYNGLSEFKKSVSDLDSAIILDPDDLASYIDRGKTKGYLDDLDGAKKDFDYVLTKDSVGEQGQGALYYLGSIAIQQNKAQEAIKLYDRLLILVPNDAEVYFNRGFAKGMLFKDLEGSIKDYDKAIELNPNYKEAYANRGVAKINLLTTRGNIQPTKEQTTDACKDLKKAQQLGDTTVEDMLYVYCK